MNADAEHETQSDPQLVRATVRLNTSVFGAILGLLTGMLLLALALVAGLATGAYMRLPVALLGVFIPGYDPGWVGGLAGLFWGFVGGGLLGAGVYRIATRSALTRIDELVAFEGVSRDFPEGVLRLDGPSLGMAIGAMGALGLIATTGWLVIRGTAAQSIHARLLSEILPGYSVSFSGSLIGAAEFFVIVYLVCQLFVLIYNRVAGSRPRFSRS